MKWSVITNHAEYECESLGAAFKRAAYLSEDHQWVSLVDENGAELDLDAAFDRLWTAKWAVHCGGKRKEFDTKEQAIEFAALCMMGTEADSVRLIDTDELELDVMAEIDAMVNNA